MMKNTNTIMQKEITPMMHGKNAPPEFRLFIDSCFPNTFREQSNKHNMIFQKFKTKTL